MSAFKILILSLFLFTNVICKNDNDNLKNDENAGHDVKAPTGLSRSKRTLDDVYNLVKDDEIYILLLCDICIDKYDCKREYCKFCGDCMKPEVPEIEMNEKHQNDEETCSYCLNNGCKNTKICHKCSICHGK